MRELDKFKKSNCTCSECISYCERAPGWFRPKETTLLAKFLGLTIRKTFEKYLIADFWVADPQNIYILTPIKDFKKLEKAIDPLKREIARLFFECKSFQSASRDKAGGRASWGYPFWRAPCIFLKNNRCTIYSVRPFECAIVRHKKETPENIRELISREWGDDHLVETLLNRETKEN